MWAVWVKPENRSGIPELRARLTATLPSHGLVRLWFDIRQMSPFFHLRHQYFARVDIGDIRCTGFVGFSKVLS